MDQPTSLSQFLRENYLAEARAHHRHGEGGHSDSSPSRRLLYGTLKGKAEDSGTRENTQFPDLSAFLSQEELDKSVNLAREAIGHEPHENETSNEAKPPQTAPSVAPAMTSSIINPPADKTENTSLTQPFTSNRQALQNPTPLHDGVMRNNRVPREPSQDFKRPIRNQPYGLETQSKKEFLNKAADFIEELSSLFKANSSKRVRPRSCKAHRSRNKPQPDGMAFSLNVADERERPIHSFSTDPSEALCEDFAQQEVEMTEQETFMPGDDALEEEAAAEGEAMAEVEGDAEAEAIAEAENENMALLEGQTSEEPVYEPPHFIQKIKSREVPEGSKVQLDCIVRGLPVPEVRWFCEGKELENSPDIQIINNGEQHSLIIAEAFEEDTGRYSCFASNFYGTDSTSAEIYIEGASSSDSEPEQHFDHLAQVQGKAVQSQTTLPSASSSQANAFVEDSLSAPATVYPEAAPPSEVFTQPATSEELCPPPPAQVLSTPLPTTQVVSPLAAPQLEPAPLTIQDTSVPVFTQEIPLEPPLLEQPEVTQVASATVSTQLDSSPPLLPPLGVPSSSPALTAPLAIPEDTAAPLAEVLPTSLPPLVVSTQSNGLEGQNGGSYPQGLDGRPIMAAPVFTKSLQDVLASEGQLVVLECRVKGVPSPKVEWYREGTLIEDSPDFRILQKKPRSLAESEEICTLVIAEVFPEDSGTFTCTASNKYGTVSSIAALKVKGNDTNTNHVKTLSSLNLETTLSKVSKQTTSEYKASSVKSQLDGSLTNCNKAYSSTLSLHPLSSGHHLDAYSTSMPSLDPLSLGSPHLDAFRSTLPRAADPTSFSMPRLDPLSINQSAAPYQPPSSRPLQLNSTAASLWPNNHAADPGPPAEPGPVPIPAAPAEPLTSCLKPQLDQPSARDPEAQTLLFCNPPVGAVPLLSRAESKAKPPEPKCTIPLPDPPASCLKSRPEGVLVNHREPRSASRVGLRVHFRLPEDEEEEEVESGDGSSAHEDPSPKEPPPVLAKPKLDPVQLQLLHNQVLLEQQQEGGPPSQDKPQPSPSPSPWASRSPQEAPAAPLHSPFTDSSCVLPITHAPVQARPAPTPIPPPAPQDSRLVPQFSPAAPPVLSPMMPRVASTSAPPVSMSAPTAPKLAAPPVAQMPPMNMAGLSVSAAPPPHMSPMAPPTSMPRPYSTSYMPAVGAPPVPKFMTAPTSPMSVAPSSLPTVSSSMLNIAPLTPLSPVLSKPPVAPLSPPPPVAQAPAPQHSLPPLPPVSSLFTGASNSQSFSYARPKEFIAAQTLSPVRSPSPTESPVPLLHELAAELNLKLAREMGSPLSPASSVSNFPTSPRVFHTRVLEPPTSPTYVSSPTMIPPAFHNTPFIRAQSPPQASSPSSSSSTPSPIQNPVAFLSSVLPSLSSLGGSQSTNSMGLPKRAPIVPQSILRKTARSQRLPSDEDIRESKESLIHDIEKKLRFKEDTIRQGAQKLPYEGKAASRPLGPNIPTATVINYDEEYKVSNFEQRLMSEIEFRLERTPVEESDDDVQHDEIPTGKCIAPLFDKKLKNYRAMEGAPLTFTCKVVGIPIPKVYWFKDGKQILKKNDHYKKYREGDGTCALHIEAVTNDDDGNYTVMAANPQGRMSCSGHLIVQTGPVRSRQQIINSQRVRARVQEVEEGEPIQERFFRPHFLQAPGDMVAHEGRLCRLDCKVSGLPNPEIMWLRNGQPIYPDFTHRMLVRENGIHSLITDPLTKKDAGTYTCIASNKAGQSSFCLELRVVEKEMKHPPQFVEKLQNTGIAEGIPVRLECRVVGMPAPVIFWKKDNETIPHSRDRMSMHQDATGYVCLLIQPTRKEDAGWYTVSAKNEAGIISCTARLDIYASAATFN
ncbi:myopalladin isoform X3 [Alosa sapidissima]|uniref:myopalladin isoform X3 n=1 Tax=Alosa sapidissima TaxID=34773 RepID=UPI001C08A13B|nr:myopalladin isoform X3 [Alosa sapidissima]